MSLQGEELIRAADVSLLAISRLESKVRELSEAMKALLIENEKLKTRILNSTEK